MSSNLSPLITLYIYLYIGVCNHAFHFHCISRWLNTSHVTTLLSLSLSLSLPHTPHHIDPNYIHTIRLLVLFLLTARLCQVCPIDNSEWEFDWQVSLYAYTYNVCRYMSLFSLHDYESLSHQTHSHSLAGLLGLHKGLYSSQHSTY